MRLEDTMNPENIESIAREPYQSPRLERHGEWQVSTGTTASFGFGDAGFKLDSPSLQLGNPFSQVDNPFQ